MNKLKKSMRSALAVAVSMAAFVASAVETIELLDVHQEGATRGTLSYTYKASNLDPTRSYQLKTVVIARLAGSSGSRTEKTKTLTEALSNAGGTATKTVNLTSTFGSGTYVDCEVLLSIVGIVDDVPPGTVFDFAGVVVPDGYLVCDGSSLSRTAYPNLFAAIGTLYGYKSSTTFNLPNFNGKFTEGTGSLGSVGTSHIAGLPDISGQFKAGWMDNSALSVAVTDWSGVFSGFDGPKKTHIGYSPNSVSRQNKYCEYIKLLASSGEMHGSDYRNDVYGQSETVQPASVLVKKIIKY